MGLREAELVKRGWHQVGAGHWMHPSVLAGEQRFTLEEAISYETIASVEESKKPVSFTPTKIAEGCASCKNLRADLTALANILIPEVIAEGKGFTTESLLDAARKAHDKPEPVKHYDEQAMEGLAADQDDAKAKVVAKRIVNVLCHGTTCLISGRDEQVEQIVLSALQNERPAPPEPDELPEPWDAEVDRRLKAVDELVQRALVRVHKNAHEINLMKADLYPLEHPRRKAVDDGEGGDG